MTGRHRARPGVIRSVLALVVPVVGAAALAAAVVLGSAGVSDRSSAVAIPTFPSEQNLAARPIVAVSAAPFAANRVSEVARVAVADASTAVDVRVAQDRAARAAAREAARAEERAAAARAEAARAAAARAEAAAAAAAAEKARAAATPTAPPARVAPAPSARPTPAPTPAPRSTPRPATPLVPDLRPGPVPPDRTGGPNGSGPSSAPGTGSADGGPFPLLGG